MENESSSILGRLGEKTLGWIALGVLILIGVWIYRLGEAGRGDLWNWVWRSGVWLAIVAAVPWSTKLFIRRVLDRSSNMASVALIGSLTAVDALAGMLLLYHWPTGWWWLATLVVLAVAGVYNYLVSEYVSEMAGG
jgi:hypothetical protein